MINHFKSIELFAGAGGMALGMEKAGFEPVLLNEFNKQACDTLSVNRPHWNVVKGDIREMSFTEYEGDIDIVSGGFPCQAFSYAGKRLGFEDVRGTLFFEYARAIREIKPKMLLAENVKGLLRHDDGKTIETIVHVLQGLGYVVFTPTLLKAVEFNVPQKRERVFIVGIREDLYRPDVFEWPEPQQHELTVRDALKKGRLYDTDVPDSVGAVYPKRKHDIMAMVPPGGYWKDLPDAIQREYMLKAYHLGGGKTGIARRLHWDQPSLTLTCAPAQKQTERCHPEETRPLTVREYARIQTFPDNWEFKGSMSAQYSQIGNAVPVNLAYAMALSLNKSLFRINNIEI